jgi:hypothetical protein
VPNVGSLGKSFTDGRRSKERITRDSVLYSMSYKCLTVPCYFMNNYFLAPQHVSTVLGANDLNYLLGNKAYASLPLVSAH